MGNRNRSRHDNCPGTHLVNIPLLALAALAFMANAAVTQEKTGASVLVETATVVSQQVRQTISAYGVVEPDPNALTVVALPRAGLITRLFVRLGERVKAGDPLLVLDTAPGTRMEFVQAEAGRKYAEGQLERSRHLFAEQMATRDQVASAERALSDANAKLSALKGVGADQNQQTIRAGDDGIVTVLSVNAGDRVAANTAAMFLAQLTGLVVRFGIEPEDARRVPDNAPLEIESVFQIGIRISTRLQKIGAMINPSTRLVDAVALIPDEVVGQLTLGDTMRAEITLAEQSALLVPRSAVLRDEHGAYVFSVENDRARRINVRIVYESSTETGIASVLAEGAVVVRSGNYELTDGMAIRVRDDNK